MNTTQPTTTSNSKEEALSMDAILKLAKIYGLELLRFSWLIAIISISLGWYMYRSKASIPVQFVAAYSFTINQSSGADQSFMQQVLGSGMLGGFMPDSELGDGTSQTGMLQELMKTRKIIELALFQKAILPDKKGVKKEDYLINHYLELFGARDAWKAQKSPLADIHFKHDSVDIFTPEENSVLMVVHHRVAKTHLTDALSKAGILTLTFRSPHEAFSYTFLHKFYDELNTYYTLKSVEKQRMIFEASKIRRDSLSVAMDKAEQQYISYLNSHNLAAQGQYAETIEIQYLARKLSGEMDAYFMAVRNTEAAKIALEQQTPLLQAIDKPIYPLWADRPNPFSSLMFGCFVGGFLGLVLVLGQKFLREFLKNNAQKAKLAPPTPVATPTTLNNDMPTP